MDYYQLLSVPRNASQQEIKSAYHRVLLTSHPDKQPNQNRQSHQIVDIALLKEAYTALSSIESRKAYDARFLERSYPASGPRPAQVVSLEEFDDEATDPDEGGPWKYPCRCGGVYRITTSLMEQGEHLIACTSCSEAVWVGYELSDP